MAIHQQPPATNAQALKTWKYNIIQAYIDSFYRVILLDGKIPIDRSWQISKGLNSPESVGTLNYGIALDDDVLVVDIDPRNFPEGQDSYKLLCEHIGVELSELDTLVVQTGGGGRHIYLNKKIGQKVKNELPQFKGVEYKTKGRQVLGPGCLHPETKRWYKILKGSPDSLAVAPETLIRLVARENYDSTDVNKHKGTADDNDVSRYVNYLEADSGAVEGDGGDNHTFSVICRGRDFGLSEDQVLRCLIQCWNDKCCPPWSEADLAKKVENAFMYNRDTAGKRSATAIAEVVDDLFDDIDIQDIQYQDQLAHAEKTVTNSYPGELIWQYEQRTGMFKKTFTNTMNFLLAESVHLKHEGSGGELAPSPFYRAFQYNLFTSDIEVCREVPWEFSRGNGNPRSMTDSDAMNIRLILSRDYLYEVKLTDVFDAMLLAAKRQCYHPIKSYLNNLEWDGTPRVETWLNRYAGVVRRDRYIRDISKIILCAAVARVFSPGCEYHYVLVLEGPQGAGKTRLVRTLGGKWAGSITIDPGEKDTVSCMEGLWIVEMGEMVTHKRSDAEQMKDFITRPVDKVRKPYARNPIEIPRQSIFIGTINPQRGIGWAKDPTGNRRFWPVEVGEMDIDALERDRDQLWAEAVQLYQAGQKLYLDADVEEIAKVEQHARSMKDPYEQPILDYINSGDMVKHGQVFSPEYILQFALNAPKSRMTTHELSRVTCILDKYYIHGCYYDTVAQKNKSGYRKDKLVGGEDEI